MTADHQLAARFKTYLRALVACDRKTLDALGSRFLEGKAALTTETGSQAQTDGWDSRRSLVGDLILPARR